MASGTTPHHTINTRYQLPQLPPPHRRVARWSGPFHVVTSSGPRVLYHRHRRWSSRVWPRRGEAGRPGQGRRGEPSGTTGTTGHPSNHTWIPPSSPASAQLPLVHPQSCCLHSCCFQGYIQCRLPVLHQVYCIESCSQSGI